MTMAYVLIAGTGEYSHRLTWPARVYLDKAQAEAALVVLDEIQKRYRRLAKIHPRDSCPNCDKVAELRPKLIAEYAALGFEVEDFETDWELNEAPIIEPTQKAEKA